MAGRDDRPGPGGDGRSVDAEPCDVCRASVMEAGLDVSLLGFRNANVHRCRSCGFGQVRPRLAAAGIEALYPADYFLPGGTDVGFREYSREAQRSERDGYFLARRITGLLPRGGRLLEVGCGLGFLLHALERFAPGLEAEGVDISGFGARFARERLGLMVRAGTLEAAGFADAAFDIVLQKDLLEHVGSPREHLRETARVLRPGGFLWLVTPNGDANLAPYAALAEREPGRVPLLDQGHLSFFRKEHLERLLREEGFEVLEWKNLKLVAGLKALGRLPRRLSKYGTVPRGSSPRVEAASPAVPAQGPGEETLDRMASAVEFRRSRIRSSLPYFWFRHLLRGARNGPAFLPYGTDFEILARKAGDPG
jgi:SAM-dependent methyltransferase